jgi:hypothetical protein
MSEFQQDPLSRNRNLEPGRIKNMTGIIFDFTEVFVDSIKTGAIGAVHIGATALHIGTDALRLDRRD